MHNGNIQELRLLPLHYTRAVDASPATVKRLERATSGIWMNWHGLRVHGGVEYVSREEDADAVLLFESLPFFFQWRKEFRDDPASMRGTRTELEIEVFKRVCKTELPVIYFLSDVDLMMNDPFERVKWRRSLYREWGLEPVDPKKVFVVHYCSDEDKLHERWEKKYDTVKVPRENFFKADIDATYWLGGRMNAMEAPMILRDEFMHDVVYMGNARKGTRIAFLKGFPGVHIYGKWGTFGCDKYKPQLPDAVFHPAAGREASTRILQKSWGQLVTQFTQAMDCKAKCARIAFTVSSGSIPLVDSRMAYELPEEFHHLLIDNQSDVGRVMHDVGNLGRRANLVAQLQRHYEEHYRRNNLALRLREIVGIARARMGLNKKRQYTGV